MKPKLILTADWHLREDTPACRTDDFWNAQWDKVRQIKELYKNCHCPIVHAGDLFHNWKPSPRLLSWCINFLPPMYILPGNHDLPNHNIDLIEKSGLWTLYMAGRIEIIRGGLGEIHKFEFAEEYGITKTIGVTHQLIYHPQSDTSPKTLLKRNPEFYLIVSGDNHESFTKRCDGRLLVNPGSLMRQTADQVDHVPSVYLWYENNIVKRVVLKCEDGIISREHLEKKEAKDIRINTFVKRLNEDYDLELSFEKNLENHFKKNRTRKTIEHMVWESVDG